MALLPTQTYKPKDFEKEVNEIKANTSSRYNYLKESYELVDYEGNVFEIDFNDGTITITIN
jgi:hypothetical protein